MEQMEEAKKDGEKEKKRKARIERRYAHILHQLHRLADTVEVNTVVLAITQAILIYLALHH